MEFESLEDKIESKIKELTDEDMHKMIEMDYLYDYK